MRRSVALASLGAALAEVDDRMAEWDARMVGHPEDDRGTWTGIRDAVRAGELVRVLPSYGLLVVLDDLAGFPA